MGQSVIEINGTRYDARTGKVVHDTPSAPAATAPKGHAVDGILASKPIDQLALAPKPRVKTINPRQRIVSDINMVHSGKTHKSKTLMRHAVKKPGTRTMQDVTPIQHTPSHAITPSPSYTGPRPVHHVAKHEQIHKFAPAHHSKITPTVVTDLSVKAPQNDPSPAPPPVSMHTPEPKSVSFVDAQLAKATTPDKQPKAKTPLRKRVFGKLKRGRLQSVAFGVMAVALMGGFLVYQNMPTISLALANREAGIAAKLPDGIPSNFEVTKVAGSNGTVVLSYKSRVDNREFALSQVKADTTIKSLEEVIARTSANQYQTYEAGGITLFMSPGDRVDWIDGDMRYNIDGSTGFSPDQIAQIATSL